MAAEQRRLLEQLMGDQLLSGPSNNSYKQPALTLSDPKVCRSHIAGSCPHDLFTNTKQDLGTCPKAHQPNLKEEYLNLPEEERKALGFEWDYSRDIGRYVGECDRRIDTAMKRLEKTGEEVRQTNALLKAIGDLTRTLEAGVLEVEVLAEEGSVNMAVQEFFKLRQAKAMKEEKERELKVLSDTSGPSGHQKLQKVGGSFFREDAFGVCADEEGDGEVGEGDEGACAAG
ncbi:splicing factor [Elasticomyces elasticus]|uniref:Splicing factor n=1 Tax=Elasticomyces elasticus TaxID=574655 RepID=A0AAN7WB95_9PEZI|nr:splicing factor [Elasticomyces elasticus]